MKTQAQINEALAELSRQRDRKGMNQSAKLSRLYMEEALRWVLGKPNTITATVLEEKS